MERDIPKKKKKTAQDEALLFYLSDENFNENEKGKVP